MRALPLVTVVSLTSAVSMPVSAQDHAASSRPQTQSAGSEQGVLANQVQLTFADRFVRAGEAYFSPDGSHIIFQAIEVPPAGESADEFYAMFLGELEHDEHGTVTGLGGVRRISPEGSANTCGWFDPRDPGAVLFASTVTAPSDSSPPGYQRSSGRYRWMFPPEMRIVSLRPDAGDPHSSRLEVIEGDADHYQAEASISPDGRHLLFCSLESGQGDLFVRDLETGRLTRVVQAEGYDGGPFFSPDGKRICYRSDRRNDHLLQLFVADLAFDDAGTIVGIEREHQVTDNGHVNWCPFWDHSGRFLIYATSEVGHHNYEIFVVDADPGDIPGSDGTLRYGTRRQRVTNAHGADVLPAFSPDGTKMMWTSKRGPDETAQLWIADFLMDLDAPPTP